MPWGKETRDYSPWNYCSSTTQARLKYTILEEEDVWSTDSVAVEGLSIVTDGNLELTLVVADSLQHYPQWMEERKTYSEKDYPKASYSYSISIPLQKGLNQIGWMPSEVNYRQDSNSAVPTFALIVKKSEYLLQQFSMSMDENMEYKITNVPYPESHLLYDVSCAPPRISLLTVRGDVPSLFTLAIKNALIPYFATRLAKRKIIGASNGFHRKIQLSYERVSLN